MAEIIWTEIDASTWEGHVESTLWYTIINAFGSWFLSTTIPAPANSATSFGTLALAKAAAQSNLDQFTSLLADTDRDIFLRTALVTVPTLLLNGHTDVEVLWPSAMPSATYAIELCILSSGLVGKVTPSVLSQDEDGATVRITASGGAVLLAGNALLVANCLA